MFRLPGERNTEKVAPMALRRRLLGGRLAEAPGDGHDPGALGGPPVAGERPERPGRIVHPDQVRRVGGGRQVRLPAGDHRAGGPRPESVRTKAWPS